MTNSILLSILIPTRNRYSTLIPVINTIQDHIQVNNYEIIVQDNSDNIKEISKYLDGTSASNVKYFHTKEKLSMVQNSELAISNANGEYLIFIGDDDIVNPIIIKAVQMMKARGIKSLIYPIANYFYQNVTFHKIYGFNRPGSLSINREISMNIKVLDTEEELRKVVGIGAIYILDLPRLYHGIIERKLIEEVKLKFGKYIPGPCPDMTTSTALACILKKHHQINIPLSISGVSSASEGGKGPTNSHIVKLENKDWLDQNDILDWNSNIPRIFSRETIWAQSAYHVLSLIKDPINFNFKYIYDSMIFSSPKEVLQYVEPLYNRLDMEKSERKINLFKAYTKRHLRNVLFSLPSVFLDLTTKIRGDYRNTTLVSGLNTIEDCIQFIERNNKTQIQEY